jgi:hypothetical protein
LFQRAVSTPTKTAPDFSPLFARQYAQPTETPHLLLMYSAQCRYNYVISGTTYSSKLFNTDRESQMLIGNLASYAATLTPGSIINYTQNNVAYQLTTTDMKNLNTQINAMVQQYRTLEAACIADLSLATPTLKTYANVDAKFSQGHW